MFSVVPHSCRLAHLERPNQRWEEDSADIEPEWEGGFTPKEGVSKLIVGPVKHSPARSTVTGKSSEDSGCSDQGQQQVPTESEGHSYLQLEYTDSRRGSQHKIQQHPAAATVDTKPDMLSPVRNSSLFKFVEFTTVHETNVIHRIPSTSSTGIDKKSPSSSLLSPPNLYGLEYDTDSNSSSGKNSPSPTRKTARSRRRCIQCGGLIQFADRKVANGQHWHQQCFKCATCGRFLDPGKHQEYDGQPYCKTCYTTLTQTHQPVMPPQSPQEKLEIISKIEDYNLYKQSRADHIKHREVGDGSLVYEGVIKLYWGLRRHITLSSNDYRRPRGGTRESLYNYVSIDDDGFSRMFENAQRNSGEEVSKEDLMALTENGIDGGYPQVTQSLNEAALFGNKNTDTPSFIPEGDDYVLQTQSDGEGDDDSDNENDYVNVMPLRQSVVMRQKSDIRSNRFPNQIGSRRRSASFKKVQKQRRQAEARESKRSRFIPPYGKPTNLRVSSIQGSDEVISMLLQKYNVENPPSQFALFVMHDSGAIEVLESTDSPLAVRLKLGPSEEVAKVYVMESSDSQKVVSKETAEYIKFQIPELNLFLTKYNEEEERETEKLKKRFEVWKATVNEQLQLLIDGGS